MAQPQASRQQNILGGIPAGLLALALAACGTTRGPVHSTQASAAMAEKPAPPPAQRNRVAVLVPTTGPNAAIGQSIANAANMALLDSGSQRIQLAVYDTGPGAAAAAQRALADGNRLFLGPLLAPDARAVQTIAAHASVPVLSFSNDADVAGNGTFVMGFQPGQSIARVVAFARSRGVTRFAALIPAGTYGQRASNAILRAVEAEGGRVVAMENYSRDAASLGLAVRKIAGKGPNAKSGATVRSDGTVARGNAPQAAPFEALLIADSGKIAVAAMPMLAKSGITGVRFLGTELWNNEPGLSRVPALRGAWFAAVPDTVFTQLATRYRARFGTAPYRLASFGYDAVLLVNRVAANWEFGKSFPMAALTDHEGFAGVDGAFRFDHAGVADRGLEVQQVDANGFTTISPAPKSFGK